MNTTNIERRRRRRGGRSAGDLALRPRRGDRRTADRPADRALGRILRRLRRPRAGDRRLRASPKRRKSSTSTTSRVPEEPQPLDLLPGGEEEAPCGVSLRIRRQQRPGPYHCQRHYPGHRRWLSADGRYVFFPSSGAACSGPVKLYLRDIEAGDDRAGLRPGALGPRMRGGVHPRDRAGGLLLDAGAADEDDSAVAMCPESGEGGPGNELRRRRLPLRDRHRRLRCVTCVAAVPADVVVGGDDQPGALASDRRRRAGRRRLLQLPAARCCRAPPRRGPTGSRSAGPKPGAWTTSPPGPSRPATRRGAPRRSPPTGGVLVFASRDPRLDPQGGAQRRRHRCSTTSTASPTARCTCVSCPPDGSAPRGPGSSARSRAPTPRARSAGRSAKARRCRPTARSSPSTPPARWSPPTATRRPRARRPCRARTSMSGAKGGRCWSPTAAPSRPAPTTAAAPRSRPRSPPRGATSSSSPPRGSPPTRWTATGASMTRARAAASTSPPRPPPCDLNAGACRGAPSAGRRPAAGAGSAAFQGPGDPARRRSCAPLSRRLRSLAHRNRALRRRAHHAGSARRATALRRRAARLARKSRRLRKSARRCRRANRRAGR